MISNRRGFSFVVAGAILFGAAFAQTSFAQALPAKFTSTIVAQSSGICLDIKNSSSQPGAGVDQSSCSGTLNQNFEFIVGPEGYYSIRPQSTDNLCLDGGTGTETKGTQIVQNNCSGSSTQRWKLRANGDGSFVVTTINGTGCFDVYGGSKVNGAIITTFACHGSSNENFLVAGSQGGGVQSIASGLEKNASSASRLSTPDSFTSTIVTQWSGSCLDISKGSIQAGLAQWNCSGKSNQLFKFSAVGNGYYTIRSKSGGLCLDAGLGSQTTGIQIVQDACMGSNTQKWKLKVNTDGSFVVTEISGAGCFDVYGGSKANGAIVTTFACHGSSNQNFLVAGFRGGDIQSPTSGSGKSASSGSGFSIPASFSSTIVTQSSGSCLDINNASSQASLGLDQWSCSGKSNQLFKFIAAGNGYYTIRPKSGGLCLDAGSGSQTTGIQIMQKPCTGSNTQKWKLKANSDGSFIVTAINGAGCFDVYGGSKANGAVVTTYACHDASNESFVISGVHSASAQASAKGSRPGSSSSSASSSSGLSVAKSS